MYEQLRTEDGDDNYNYIDLSRVKLLSDIVNATDAKTVLSSSWRLDWDKSPDFCGTDGKYINQSLATHGLSIMDKSRISVFLPSIEKKFYFGYPITETKWKAL